MTAVLVFVITLGAKHDPFESVVSFIRQRFGAEGINRLLTAYHEFASHKIVLELRQNLDEGEFFFNPEELSEEDTDKLKQGLEAVTILQRQVYQAMVEGR